MKNCKKLIALTLCLAMLLMVACQSKDNDKKSKKDKDDEEIEETIDDDEDPEETEETEETKETEEPSETEETEPSDTDVPAIEVISEAEFVDGLTAETSYTFNLVYNNDDQTLSGTMIANVKNCSGDAWKDIVFEDWTTTPFYTARAYQNYEPTIFSNSSITIDGETTDVELVRGKDLSSLRTPLSQPLLDGETITVVTDFLIHIPYAEDRYGYVKCDEFELVALGNALPVLALYEDGVWQTHEYVHVGESFNSETAYYDVTFTCPSEFQVVMTGNPEFDGTSYHSTQSYVRDFTIMLATNHTKYEDDYNGIHITVFGPSSLASEFPTIAEQTKSIITFYNEMIGEYLYDSIDVCLIDLSAAQGMEYPELVTVNAAEALKDAYVLAHELGHEWFYLMIGNDEYEEPWLDESITSYISYLYMDSIGEAPEGMLIDEETWELIEGYYDFTLITVASDRDYVVNAYSVGPTFLDELHALMGDDAFYDSLKEIYDTFLLKQANTDDVLNIFRSHTDEDLEPLIEKYFVVYD